jgi:hypothetical protein
MGHPATANYADGADIFFECSGLRPARRPSAEWNRSVLLATQHSAFGYVLG